MAPFKDNHLVIADNHDVAKRRLKCLVNGLSDKPKTLQGYNNVIQEQLRKDNIEEVGQQVREMKINWYDEQPPKISGISIKIVQDIIGTGQPRYHRCFRKTSTLMMCKRCSSMEMETAVKSPYLAYIYIRIKTQHIRVIRLIVILPMKGIRIHKQELTILKQSCSNWLEQHEYR